MKKYIITLALCAQAIIHASGSNVPTQICNMAGLVSINTSCGLLGSLHAQYALYNEVEDNNVRAYIHSILTEAGIADATSIALYYTRQNTTYKGEYRSLIMSQDAYFELMLQFRDLYINYNDSVIRMKPVMNEEILAKHKEAILAAAPNIVCKGRVHMLLANILTAAVAEALSVLVAPYLGVPEYAYNYTVKKNKFTLQEVVQTCVFHAAKTACMVSAMSLYHYFNLYGRKLSSNQ